MTNGVGSCDAVLSLREPIERVVAVVLSVLLPIWNLVRLVVRARGARQFAVGVVGLRAIYKPAPIGSLDWEDLISRLGSGSSAGHQIVIPRYEGDPKEPTRGSTSVPKLLTIAALLQFHGAGSAFEIGTYRGVGTTWIAANLNGGDCHTIDLPLETSESEQIGRTSDRMLAESQLRRARAFEGTEWEDKIIQHWGSSLQFDFSEFDGQMDFVYVDGDHSHQAILSDTVNALRMLSDDGFIVWDDYLPFHLGSHPGVREFLNWFGERVDEIYEIGGQAAWFARLSGERSSALADRCLRLAPDAWKSSGVLFRNTSVAPSKSTPMSSAVL